ncbi:MAG TPA: N-acetylmuramoyl-L-alanine amidase [Mycobacteriales bacterium]|nr:N-acetylmuramoyl-L-alanine amidase [Mycobacteriales bacterium]
MCPSPSVSRVGALLTALAVTGCAVPRAAAPAPSATGAVRRPSADAAVRPPAATTFGGADVRWPLVARTTAAPPALGAELTVGTVRLAGGGALPAGLTLPRLGGTDAAPTVLTPCARTVTLLGRGFTPIPAAAPGQSYVVIDPGHGGSEDGTVAADGTREADRVLAIALLLRADLVGHVTRVLMTRRTDQDTSLAFRVALADAVRASLAVSVHLNSHPDGPSTHPGTETFGSVADPAGRRAAGVLYEAERRYLDTLTPAVHGRWVANRDAGALYRLGQHGDYYFVLRASHVPWVISESLYLSDPREEVLLAEPSVRAGLAAAMGSGIREFLFGRDPGSGWRVPIARPADPPPPPGQDTCVDPTVATGSSP